jgi:hypothetical protein
MLASFSISVSAFSQSIAVPRPVPYAADSDIAGNIKRECAIDVKLADFIAEYANERHVPVSLVGQTDASMPGRVLVIEIQDSESSGNAFIGHHKSTKVRGSYFEDSKLVGSFKDRRDSMGGMFAGFKGSCSVLGRTVKEIGKDIAEWLEHPVLNADLGDLK